jgi:hypothetical protein
MKSQKLVYFAALALALSCGANALAAPTRVTVAVGTQAPSPSDPGSPAAYSVTITKSGKKSVTVSLSASGLPAGVTAFFRQNSFTFPAGSRSAQTLLTLSTPGNLAPGTYPITVMGTYNHGVRGVTATLVVGGTSIVGPPPAITSLKCLPDGSASLSCAGVAGQTFYVQATPDLGSPAWTTISTNSTDAAGACLVVETGGANHSSRFYRTFVVP